MLDLFDRGLLDSLWIWLMYEVDVLGFEICVSWRGHEMVLLAKIFSLWFRRKFTFSYFLHAIKTSARTNLCARYLYTTVQPTRLRLHSGFIDSLPLQLLRNRSHR